MDALDITMLRERVLPPMSVGNTLGNARALTETRSEMLRVEHPDCCLTRKLTNINKFLSLFKQMTNGCHYNEVFLS